MKSIMSRIIKLENVIHTPEPELLIICVIEPGGPITKAVYEGHEILREAHEDEKDFKERVEKEVSLLTGNSRYAVVVFRSEQNHNECQEV